LADNETRIITDKQKYSETDSQTGRLMMNELM